MTKTNQKAAKSADQSKSAKPDYVLTEHECRIAAEWMETHNDVFPPRITLPEGKVKTDHPEPAIGDVLMARSLGTNDVNLGRYLALDLAFISVNPLDGRSSESTVNQALAYARAIEPKDSLEAMMAVQMAAVHSATIAMARRLNTSESIEAVDSAERGLSRLSRAFTQQVETLKRHRSGGQQNVTVKHVHVNDGGQAIIGNVTNREGGEAGKENQPHEPKSEGASDDEGTALLGHFETIGVALPSAGDEGLDSVPVSRSKGRSPKG